MGESVELLCFGIRLEKVKYLDQTSFVMLKGKFGRYKRTSRQLSLGRKVMQMCDDES